jgi:hypothetical protein
VVDFQWVLIRPDPHGSQCGQSVLSFRNTEAFKEEEALEGRAAEPHQQEELCASSELESGSRRQE